MRRAVILLMVLGLGLIMSVGTASAQLDFLSVEEFKSDPAETAESGDRIDFQVTLKKSGIRPHNAMLVITNELVAPVTEITINGGDSEVSNNRNRVEKELDSTVDKIEITVTGKAPTVSKKVRRILLDVKTDVYYDEEHKGFEDEISFPLYITNPTIEDAVNMISDARDKLKEANKRILNLEAKGVDVSDLEEDVITVEGIIDEAEYAHDAGQPIQAKRLAESAIGLLDDIIYDARELERTSAKTSDIKEYLAIGAAVIVVLAAFLYFKGKREELG